VTLKGFYVLLGLFILIVAIQKQHFEYDLNNTSVLVIPHVKRLSSPVTGLEWPRGFQEEIS
jgi:hypothetical protein